MLKLLSLFSGIGAFEKALENIDEPFEVVRYCEIDKYASKAYSLIHHLDENLNLKDVCSINTEELPDDIDIITYGFPCQDISLSGRQKGFTDENGDLTRSGLFFEALYIIEQTKPKIAIAENVKALTSKKFTAEFKIVLDSLNDAGYKNYWALLNSKDYGIPQNRERVFIISIRNDIDHGFQFPEKYELKLRLRDLLEDTVDEQYYLSDKMLAYFIRNNELQKAKGNGFRFEPTDGNGICGTINTAFETRMQDTFIKESVPVQEEDYLIIGGMQKHQSVKKDGICTTLTASMGTGGEYVPMVIANDECLPIKEATKKGYKEAHEGDYVNLQFPNSETRRGRVGEQIANTLLCNDAQGVVLEDLRIRKLTPKECFRLMGFDDKDCDVLVENKISNTQLYKMAGNSIVVDVLEEIFVELLNQYDDVFPMR